MGHPDGECLQVAGLGDSRMDGMVRPLPPGRHNLRLTREVPGRLLHGIDEHAGFQVPGAGTTDEQTITREQANQLLKDHLKEFEGSVIGLLNATKVNQNQFDALVSFCFNLGAGNLAKSQLLRFIKANPNDPKIAAEFLKWNRAGGEVSTGLVRRRKKEAQLYFTPIV